MRPILPLYYATLLWCWQVVSPVLAQEILLRPVEVDKKNKLIYIPYQLRDERSLIYEYNIRLFYSQDNGRTFQGPLQYLQGHSGPHILPGEDKLIVWEYLKDNPHFDGLNLKFKVWSVFEKSVMNLAGPEAALHSLYLPGKGNAKVRFLKHSHRWLYLTGSVAALLGGGIWLRTRANQHYQAYLQAPNFAEADPLFAKARRGYGWGNALLIAGGSLWLGDILQTVWQGIRNRKKQRQIQEKNAPLPIHLRLSYYPGEGGRTVSLGFKF